MTDRDIIKIAVEPSAKQAIDEACRRYGMTQIEMASRIYRWFAEQEETIQASILEILPGSLAVDVARLALERIAQRPPTLAKAAKKADNPVHVNRRLPPSMGRLAKDSEKS
ncbi:MAG: hypothetical protein WC058_15370 [Phycisphaeraceae bacterium]